MSDVSVLSHEYATAADLSKAMSRALIALKRARLGVEGTPTSPQELKQARRELASIIMAVSGLLDPETGQLDRQSAARIPGSVVARLQAERRGQLEYYLHDLRTTANRLREQPTALTDEDFALLDGLTAVVDAEASRVYRRLMRR